MPLFRHERKLNLCVWDSESEQVLESHNCFVDENITAYENIANIEVHSKKKTTSTSNHAVNLSSVSSLLVVTIFFCFRESVCISYTAALILAITAIKFCHHSSSSSVSERASTSSHCQSELMSSDSWVLNKLSDSDELSSLNSSASAALCYNLHSHSVVDESDAHVSYVYAVISIDDIIKLITYKQAVKSPLCDKWKMAMKNEIQSLKNNNMWTLSTCCQISMSLKNAGFTRSSVTLMIRLAAIRLTELSKAMNSSLT
jgi:hypothetical protein